MEHREPSSREHLTAFLDRMRRKAPSLAPGPLSRLDAMIRDHDEDGFASLLTLLKEACPEEAVERLRHPGGMRTEAATRLLKALEPAAVKARTRRMARLGMDASRIRLRLRLERGSEAADLDTQDLQLLLAEALHLEGLQPALDLGRHPRPLVTWASPLSPGVQGLDEVAEIELEASPPAGWMAALNMRLPEGVRVLNAEELPLWAAPAPELACRAVYAWPCPLAMPEARRSLEVFLASETFFMEKRGKLGGQKTDKRVDLRPEIIEADWEGATLRFAMPLRPGKALNPLKLLGALFKIEPAAIRGLARLRVHLSGDPRLQQAGRFETKLKNLYEDATLLSTGGNITLVEEDDDEPMLLG